MFFYFFLVYIPTYNCQKLLIDSRINQYNQADMDMFDSKFSIWFITQKNIDKSDIFQITHNRKIILKLSNAEELEIYEDNKVKYKLNYEQEWYHTIITQYEYGFIFNLFSNSKLYSSVSFNTSAPKNETKIISNRNKNYFCLIYDSITEFSPIIQKITFYTFIMPQIIEQLLYQESSTILFLKKFQQQYQTSNILSLYNEQELFVLIEDQNNLYLLIDENINDIGYVNEEQFTVQIDISRERILIIIKLNNYHKYEITNNYGQIFYTMELSSSNSNFEHQQIILTYLSKLEDVDKQLYDLQCDNYQVYDRDHQKCVDVNQIYQVKQIQVDKTQIQLSLIDDDENMRNLIFNKILMQVDLDNIQSTQLINEWIITNQQDQSRDIYILWKFNKEIVCQKFYFGSNCKKFKKKCKLINNYCIACEYGYVNLQFNCKKCPKGCLICKYQNHTLKCILSIKGYYLNKGLSKTCNCEYCSYQGECLTIINVRELIDTCENTSCQLKTCLPSEYLNIKSQNCIILPKEIEIILFQYIDNFPFQQVEIQYQLIQSYQINQMEIFLNQMLQKLYFEIQLFQKYERLLQRDLSNRQYHFMNRYNLNCKQKRINSYGDIVCKKYSQQDIDTHNLFTLELYNVSYYNEITYQQQQYSSLTHLLQQIKDLGVKYTNITIQLCIKAEQESFVGKVFIENSLLPDHVSSANIIIFLEFPKIQLQMNRFQVLLEFFQVDFLYIIDYYAQYPVNLFIQNCQMVTVQNFSNSNQNQIQILGQSIKKLILIDLILNSKFTFIFKDVQNLEIISSDFVFQQQESLFQTLNVANMIIKNCQYNFVDSQKRRNFLTYQTQNLIFEIVFINILNSTDSELIVLKESRNIILKQIVVYGNQLNNTHVFQILSSKYQLIDQLKLLLQNSIKSIFYFVKSNQQFDICNCQVYGILVQQTNFFTIISDQVLIKQNIYLMEISNSNTIFIIQAKILIIQDYSLLSQNSSVTHISEGQYNYTYKFTIDVGSISNFRIQGMILKNYGLLSLHVSEEVKINNFLIENINFFQDSFQSLLQFQEYKNYPIYIINNMTIRNVLPVILNDNILININNAAIIQIINLTMDQIKSSMTIGYMLRLLSIQASINYFTIINCYGQNFMDIQSSIIQINHLNLQNNRQIRIFNLQTLNNQLFSIENSLISSLQISQFIYADKQAFPLLNIIIKNMTIDQIQSFVHIFYIIGEEINFMIYNSVIQQQNLQLAEYDRKNIFNLEYSRFFAYNLTVDSIQQSLFFFFESQQIILSKIQILNINTYREYLIEIVSSTIIIENLKLHKIQNCFIILKIMSDAEKQHLYFNNLLLFQLQNITEVVCYYQLQEKQSFKFQDVILIQYDLAYLVGSISEQLKIMKIQNLFTNQGQFHLQEGVNNKFCLINSFLSEVTFQVIDQDKIILQSSEAIGHQLQYTNQFQLQNSQIYDSISLLGYNRIPFFMTLSLDRGKTLQPIKQFELLFHIKLTKESFFYVPSGQKLSKYKRLNLKQLSYEQIYFGLSLVIKGFTFQSDNYYLCSQQQYYNEELVETNTLQNFTVSEEINNIDTIFIINPHNLNYTVFKINCQFDKSVSLQYNVKSFRCQLGEYLYKNQCLLCNVSQYQYSVTYNATKCQYVDFLKIKTARAGLIELKQNYWRHKYDSHIIEFCESQYCNGGWIPGYQSCVKSRIGAQCNECDLYNVRGDGQYTKNNGECTQCQQLNIKFILQFLFAILLQQSFALVSYYSNNNTSNRYLLYKIGFKQFYQILYRQSVDQPSIIIKMYTNYIFMLYVIRDNFDNIGKLFVININFMNNPSLIFQAQLSCILSELTQLNVIYSYFFYEIFLTLFIISLTFTIYLFAILFKMKNFSIGFIIFFIDSIFVYNLKIITETATNLLSYNQISQQKWIRLNFQYLFYSDTHMQMIRYIIPITVTIFLFPLIFPSQIINLSILRRKAIRIFSIYFQEYKPQIFYWEYCIIYTKYVIMILQVQQNKIINFELLVILFIVWASYNLKPYYLQNLNSYECNLLIFFSIQLNLLIQSNWVSILIISINIYSFLLFIKKIKNSYYLLNMDKILFYKRKIIKKFPRLANFIRINQNLKQVGNMKLFKQITRTKIMKKQYTPQKSINQYQLETEIELESFKQTISRIYNSRQE